MAEISLKNYLRVKQQVLELCEQRNQQVWCDQNGWAQQVSDYWNNCRKKSKCCPPIQILMSWKLLSIANASAVNSSRRRHSAYEAVAVDLNVNIKTIAWSCNKITWSQYESTLDTVGNAVYWHKLSILSKVSQDQGELPKL